MSTTTQTAYTDKNNRFQNSLQLLKEQQKQHQSISKDFSVPVSISSALKIVAYGFAWKFYKISCV